MKVALIGGTGFVGSYLIDELISNEHTPRLLVRKNSDYKVCLLYTSPSPRDRH